MLPEPPPSVTGLSKSPAVVGAVATRPRVLTHPRPADRRLPRPGPLPPGHRRCQQGQRRRHLALPDRPRGPVRPRGPHPRHRQGGRHRHLCHRRQRRLLSASIRPADGEPARTPRPVGQARRLHHSRRRLVRRRHRQQATQRRRHLHRRCLRRPRGMPLVGTHHRLYRFPSASPVARAWATGLALGRVGPAIRHRQQGAGNSSDRPLVGWCGWPSAARRSARTGGPYAHRPRTGCCRGRWARCAVS